MRVRLVAFSLALLAIVPAATAGLGAPTFVPARLDVTGRLADATTIPAGAPMPAGATQIGPGSWLLIEIGPDAFACTANWIWQDGAELYLGAAGHCFLPEAATATHGAGADFDASDVRVSACVARCEFAGQVGFLTGDTRVELGEVAYARQTRAGVDIGNDFGLVRIPAHLHDDIRTTLPVWGAVSDQRDMRTGDQVCLYGHGTGIAETYATKARAGVSIASRTDGSWRAAIPSMLGDSGSAVATCAVQGDSVRGIAAAGILTHISGTGIAGTSMARAASLAREAGLTVAPVLG